MYFRKLVKLGIGVGALTGTAVTIHLSQWDISPVGLLRFGRAALVVADIGVNYKFALSHLDDTTEEYRRRRSEVHLRSANKLLELCKKNGGVFIKVGQHIGAMDYLLPEEYVSTLKILHNDAPKTSLNNVLKVLKEDLGKETSEIFATFDPEPVGAASLAQVHKATLYDGKVVAVKVQHREVKAHSAMDMACMDLLVHIVAWLFPEFTFLWLADECKRNLPVELNFTNEGHNAERVQKMFSHFTWLKIPKIYWDMTTSRVLTMEFCDGGQVNDKKYFEENNISGKEVSSRLSQLYSEMIFIQGYIHCDPHPGNILVKKTQKGTMITLLDHGLYSTLTDSFRLKYTNLWMALLRVDMKGVEYWAKQLGVGDLYNLFACMLTARSWTAVQKGISITGQSKDEYQEIRKYVTTHLPHISEVLNRVPQDMLLVFKTNDLLRGIDSSLGVRGATASFIIMSRCCTQAVFKEQLRSCTSLLCKTKVYFMRSITDVRILLYEFFLWVWRSKLGVWFQGLLQIA